MFPVRSSRNVQTPPPLFIMKQEPVAIIINSDYSFEMLLLLNYNER